MQPKTIWKLLNMDIERALKSIVKWEKKWVGKETWERECVCVFYRQKSLEGYRKEISNWLPLG